MAFRRLACALLIALELAARAQGSHGKARPSDSGAAAVRRASELVANHKPEQAAALLAGELAAHPENAAALTLMAHIRFEAGDGQAAQQWIVKALNAAPNLPSANRLAGTLLLAQQQYPEAMDRLETVLAVLPHDAEARRLELESGRKLAAQARAAGNEEAALRVLEHVRAVMPDNPELLLDLGMEANNLRRYAEAEEALKAARQAGPKSPDVLYALARVELDEQHVAAAEADMRGYLALRPNDASARFGLGRILAMEQKDGDARGEFERSVKLQPVQTESYYELGQLDLNAHQDSEAAAMFAKVITRDPKHGGALAGLGQISFRAKNYAEAEAYLQRAKTAAPEYAPAHYYLGLTLARLGRKSEADEELRVATELGHRDSLNAAPAAGEPQP